MKGLSCDNADKYTHSNSPVPDEIIHLFLGLIRPKIILNPRKTAARPENKVKTFFRYNH